MSSVLVLVTVGLLVDFLRRPRSSSISLPHQLRIYAIQRVLDILGAYYGRAMGRDTRNFMKVGAMRRRRQGCVFCKSCSE